MSKPISRTSRLNAILAQIVKLTGYMNRSHHEARHCSRCGDGLTDPASWERGIGPVCAKKDTALFAKTIPANFAMVTMCAMSLKPANLPEAIQPIWSDLLEVVVDHAEKAMGHKENEGTLYALRGEDCRMVAKVIDWMLSFRIPSIEKNLLIDIVKYLGFVGLAGVLAGKASTGEANISFSDGKLKLMGSSNKLGWSAFRKIAGSTLPRYRGDKTPYTVNACDHEAFFSIAMEFWPCFSGDVEAVKAQCLAWIDAQPKAAPMQVAPVKVVTDNRPVAEIVRRDGDFSLKFKWVKGVTEKLILGLKEIDNAERKYDPGSYTWNFKIDHFDRVMKLLEPNYRVDVQQSSGITPANFFVRPRYAGKQRSSYRSYRD